MKRLIFVILLFVQMNFVGILSVNAFFNRDVHLLAMQDGLADNKVNSIYKDRDGFMWFATDAGLSRYDGASIRNFVLTSHLNAKISAIDELSEHYLGVVIGKTLHSFNRLTEKFIPVEMDGKKVELIQLITKDGNGCWIVGTHGLSLCNIHEEKDKAGNVIKLVLKVDDRIENIVQNENYIVHSCLSQDNKEVYAVNNNMEFIIYDLQNKNIKKLIPLLLNSLGDINNIRDYYDVVWIATMANGIFCYHKHSGVLDHISYGGAGKENLLSHPDVYDVIPINNNKLLAVTWNGYTILIPGDPNFEEFTTEIYNNVSLINRNLETRMICTYYDQQGILWIGTHGGGVLFSDLRLQYFNQFHQNRHNEICGITADDDGYIWLATFHKGIMRTQKPFESFGKIDFETVGTDEMKDKKTVLCLFKDAKGDIWFGNQDGTLSRYGKPGIFKVYNLMIDGQVNRSSVWALYMDSQKNWWIGTDEGLLLYDPLTGKCKRMRMQSNSGLDSKMPIRAIAEASDGKIWIGTVKNGLRKVINNEVLSLGYGSSKLLQNASVRSLLVSSDGVLYIGCENGLGIMNPQTEVVEHFYTTQNGLCNNFIGCMAEDAKGQIWVGSNSGISRYSRHQKLFYHYFISGSNRSTYLFDKNLFWGNNKSLTYFNPDDINAFSFSERVAITKLEVGNKVVNIGEEINGQVILHTDLYHSQQIRLNYNNRDFSLTFSNLSYSKERQKIRYRLFPYQKTWMVADKGGKVSYANLRTGEYTFEIQNLYPDERIGKINSLAVIILPHWSETFLFKLILLALAILIVVWVIKRIKLRQKRLEHELQLEHEIFTATVERDKEKQIRVEREKFFTNAVHELRTPLTLILSPLQEMLGTVDASDTIYEKLSIMYRNGASLQTLVDHLLYVQKIEAGMVKLRISRVDIVALMADITDSFRSMAETRGLNFAVELLQEPLLLWIDVEKITSAVRNLLSNAFKYTLPNGNVTVKMSRIQIDGFSFCRLLVSDTGKGIPEELQGRIFESFITGENTPLFSNKVGIGLRIVKNTMDLHHGSVTLESAPGKGSVFTLLIPEGDTYFAGDQYETVSASEPVEYSVLCPAIQVEKQEEHIQSKKSLLIIEDNEEIRHYILTLFCKEYAVHEASNGEEGLQAATEKVPDLIISDIMMPVKDGFTCCRELREQPRTAHIPILMLTAKAEDVDVLHASKIGVDDYMMKPFNPELLKSRVQNLIVQRERLKRIYTKTLMLKQQENVEATDANATDDFIQQVIHVIEAHLADENFNVKILADQLNMSQPTLYRKIKQRSELAAIDMIRSVRMSKAASLIMENRYSIQEIAEMVGYSDTRTLRKHFTEQFGVSPSKYMAKE